MIKVYFLAITILLSPALLIATESQEAAGFIEFSLAVDADALGQLRWVLLPPQSEAQVHVDSSVSRKILYDVATTLLNDKISRTVQQATPLNFSQVFHGFAHAFTKELDRQRLQLALGKVILEPFMTVGEGVERGATATLTVPIKYTLIDVPVTSLHLILAIGVPNADAYDSTTLGALGDLAHTHGLDHTALSAEEARIVVSTLDSITLTPEELQQLMPQLVQVALDALQHATAHGLAFGQWPPIFPRPDAELDKRFRFPDMANVTLFINKSTTPSFSHELTFGFLSVVREIIVEHPNDAYRMNADKRLQDIQLMLPRVWTAEFDEAVFTRLYDGKLILRQRYLQRGRYTLRAH